MCHNRNISQQNDDSFFVEINCSQRLENHGKPETLTTKCRAALKASTPNKMLFEGFFLINVPERYVQNTQETNHSFPLGSIRY